MKQRYSYYIIKLNQDNFIITYIQINKWDDRAVYLKYNSTQGGDCYMKPYNGDFVGVIFQPKIKNDDSFYQFGDLPLGTFQ